MGAMIFDAVTANAVGWYEDDNEARIRFEQLVADDPAAADELVLVYYDEEGMPVEAPVKEGEGK